MEDPATNAPDLEPGAHITPLVAPKIPTRYGVFADAVEQHWIDEAVSAAESGQLEEKTTTSLTLEPVAHMTRLVSTGVPGRYGVFADAVEQHWVDKAESTAGSGEVDANVRGLNRLVIDDILDPGTPAGIRDGLLRLLAQNDVGLARVAHVVSVDNGAPICVNTLALTFRDAAVSIQPLSLDRFQIQRDIAVGWATEPGPLVRELATSPWNLPGAMAARRRTRILSRFAGRGAEPAAVPNPLPLVEMPTSSSKAFIAAMQAIKDGHAAVVAADPHPAAAAPLPDFLHPSCSELHASAGKTTRPFIPLSLEDEIRQSFPEMSEADVARILAEAKRENSELGRDRRDQAPESGTPSRATRKKTAERRSGLRRADIESQRRGSEAHYAGQDISRSDHSRADLRGAHFPSATAYRTNFNHSNLDNANFASADLREADLSHASLHHAHMPSADLRGADLCGATLRDAHMPSADLRLAKLRMADLAGAHMYDANVAGADFYRARVTTEQLRRMRNAGAAILLGAIVDGKILDATGAMALQAQLGVARTRSRPSAHLG